MRSLGTLIGASGRSSATAVSNDGSVVVGFSRNGGALNATEAFRWTEDTGMEGLGFLEEGFAYRTSASGVSGDGTRIVGSQRDGGNNGTSFIWTAETGMVALDVSLGGRVPNSVAEDISSNGEFVVGSSTPPFAFLEAYFWDANAGVRGLGHFDDGRISTEARAISGDGSTVVGVTSTPVGQIAFEWDATLGIRPLDTASTGPSERSFYEANDVSHNGGTIVGNGGGRAVIGGPDRENQQLDVLLTSLGLDLTGWELEEATGISADGKTIVGYGYNPNGFTEGFIAVIPEPRAGLLIGIGLALLARRRSPSRFK